MNASESPVPVIPRRSQPLIAALLVVGLAALAAWFVAAGGLRGGLVPFGEPPVVPPGFSVSINAATAAELAQLPGLGAATAGRIVEHRRTHGPFASHDDLLAVPGIGPATLEKLRPFVTVGSP